MRLGSAMTTACIIAAGRRGVGRSVLRAFICTRPHSTTMYRVRGRMLARGSGSPEPEGPNPFGLDGLLALSKPEGWTSNDVVQKVRGVLEKTVRHRLGEKRTIKVGHGGTLDPLATGVLVLGVGAGCKVMGDFLKGSKGYRTVAMLGAEYDTMDSTGQVVEEMDASQVTREILEEALGKFRGNIMQRPPAFSAIKKGGKKLYELARRGETVEVEPRPVQVTRLTLTECLELPHFGLEVECGGGTYIRSLISDIGREVGTRAYMTGLVRTKQGPFVLEHCLPEDKWTEFDYLVAHIQYCNRVAAS